MSWRSFGPRSFWLLAAFRLSYRVTMEPVPSPKPCQKPKILAAHRYIFSVNALSPTMMEFHGVMPVAAHAFRCLKATSRPDMLHRYAVSTACRSDGIFDGKGARPQRITSLSVAGQLSLPVNAQNDHLISRDTQNFVGLNMGRVDLRPILRRPSDDISILNQPLSSSRLNTVHFYHHSAIRLILDSFPGL